MRIFVTDNDAKRKHQSQEIWVEGGEDPEYRFYGENLAEALEGIREKIKKDIESLQKLLETDISYAIFKDNKQISGSFKTHKEALDSLSKGTTSRETVNGKCMRCGYDPRYSHECYCDVVEIGIILTPPKKG